MVFESPEDTIKRAKSRGAIAKSMFSYYNPSEENYLSQENLDFSVNNDPVMKDLKLISYEKGGSDFIQYLPSYTVFDTIQIDGIVIPSQYYEIAFGKKIKITISQEIMDSFPAGWHDIYYLSDENITQGEIRIASDLLSTEMAKPDIDVSATGLIITDAVGPRNAVDISARQDFGVVMWYAGTTCYISTQRKNVMVTAPEDCSFLFSSCDDAEFLSNICYMDVSMLDISNVRDISYMFRGVGLNTDKFELIGIDTWDVSNILSSRFAFCETGFNATDWSIGDLRCWNLCSVTDTTGMFMNAGHNAALWSIGDISNWNMPNCISMASMFEGAGYNSYCIILDLHLWNVSNVVSLSSMFKNCGYNSKIFSLNILGWDTVNVRNSSDMFKNMGCSAASWVVDSDTNVQVNQRGY